MLFHRRQGWEIPERDVTPQSLYLDRRRFLQTGAAGAAALYGLGAAGTLVGSALTPKTAAADLTEHFTNIQKTDWGADLEPSDPELVSSYNNFYELGNGKSTPADRAHFLTTEPWTIKVDGLVKNGGTYDVEKLLAPSALEERIYRLRCVETWSMVVPWVGVPLADVIRRLEPDSIANFVIFETLYDPDRMPGQRGKLIDWPYREALRLDEAMNPLPLLAVGIYGEKMPPQNGAPIRLVVPWKYGFKSIKSIVRMRFVAAHPTTTWTEIGGNEYGFYANVNPEVDHPRWSQAKERPVGSFFRKRTQMFNGYEEQVAELYRGMDLEKNF